ncbi:MULTISPECIES: hypothetical protein [Enterobacterales]|uniref:hypothetical protein n=1 Tax=Enterobacterales TaxID=91347 RepID=UPI000847F5AD|nr:MULTISPECIES: hypothetical protein [Enterobacterales]ODQ07455.1 hypothetical protein BGK50_15770 [Shigella sp. FC130]OEI95071.1 hypothetical protein BHE86_14770 [Shigella sp. FC1655]WOO50949.1 hypothetical protein R2S03_07265 [Hafnia alvei]WPF05421.1 hypothetical protein SB028_06115 [Proteus vulgaris]
MAWNKESIKLISKPTPFPYFKWGLAIFLSIFFLIYSLSLKNKDEVIQQKELFSSVISILPLLIIIISFLYKYMDYIKNKNIYYFLYNEKKFADKKWEDWSARSVGVIDSLVFLPQKTTISYMKNNLSEHISCYNIPQYIDYLDNKNPSLYYLLKSTKKTIEKLLGTHHIEIKYLTIKDKNSVENKFQLVWKELFLNKEMPKLEIVEKLSFQYIEEIILKNNDVVEIIIIDQDYTEKQSAALAILIMASDDTNKKYHIDTIANIQRPMLIGENEIYKEAINIFSEIQIESRSASYIMIDNKSNSDMLVALFNNDNYLTKISLDNIFDIEYFIGPVGDYSSWVTIGLSVNFAYQYKKNILTLSREKDNFYINTTISNDD